MTTLMTASAQWATRPDDQRFLSLDELAEAVSNRRAISHAKDVTLSTLSLENDDSDIYLKGHNGARVSLSNYSFGQLATRAAAPAGYLRKLPAPLARLNLATSLEMSGADREEAKLLYQYPQDGQMVGQARAFTSTKYGRIWDEEVVRSIQAINADGRWQVPLEAYGGINSKRATTLYASDHDMFCFLVDPARPIELDGQTYYRGFFAYNSEVGAMTFGLEMFLFSRVCANRIVWDVQNHETIKIRHSAGGPARFMRDAAPALAAMSDASAAPIIETIQAAKATRLGKNVAEVEKWLAGKGFGRFESHEAVRLAEQGGDTGSSGDPTNLWDVIQGGTAAARKISHTDSRLNAERQWSGLLSQIGKGVASIF